jgi:hypothetical protein
MKTYILCSLLGAAVLSGCIPFPDIERSQPLTKDKAPSMIGEEVTVTLTDSGEYTATILGFTADSIMLGGEQPDLRVPLSNVESILIEGSLWGRAVGGLAGLWAFGAYLSAQWGHKQGVLAVAVGFIPLIGLPVLGEYLFTPDWRYIVTPKKSVVLEQTKQWGGTNPRYVLEVERFLAETGSTVTITWQGKSVTLTKAEITIEKHEKGYRITVPARLLQ